MQLARACSTFRGLQIVPNHPINERSPTRSSLTDNELAVLSALSLRRSLSSVAILGNARGRLGLPHEKGYPRLDLVMPALEALIGRGYVLPVTSDQTTNYIRTVKFYVDSAGSLRRLKHAYTELPPLWLREYQGVTL